MGHVPDRARPGRRVFHRRRFVCPHCERLLGARIVIKDVVVHHEANPENPENRRLRTRRYMFKKHNADPRKPGDCPGSGRLVDEVPR